MTVTSPLPPSPSTLHILHLEDSVIDHDLACLALKRAGVAFTTERVENLHAFEAALATAPDVILADYQLPGFTALDAWALVQRHESAKGLPFILLSGAIGETAAVAAIQEGISDYLLKDSMSRLAHTVARALEVSHARRAREKADLELAASERRLAELAEHLQTSIEQERAAIAREIHDDIGGALTAVKFDLAWLARHTSDTQATQHIQSGLDMLQHAIGASQRIMLDLRPPILDQGLAAALQWLIDGFTKRTGITARLHATEGPHAVGHDIQLVAYRTAQEALTNITKYAQCTRVDLDFMTDEGSLTLEISDNGRGIAAEDLAKPKSFGLKGLQERARMFGGQLDIQSRLGRGTTLSLSLQLQAPHETEQKGHP